MQPFARQLIPFKRLSSISRLHHLLLVQWRNSSSDVDLKPSEKGSDLIEVQKHRAAARWKEAFNKGYFDETVYKGVLDQLKTGKLPPIYHTLCRAPTKRLFLPNTFVSNGNEHSGSIEISSSSVTAGASSRPWKKSTKKAFWDFRDFSYLDAFFAPDGRGLVNVHDNAMEKDYWQFDKEATNIVTDLVNSAATMVGHDLEVTELLLSEFPLDFFNGKNLITRSLNRGVVADCFEHSKPGSVHAIVGSPGIGKSWSLIYALQQALLFENACVLFCFQKKKRAWACIRKKNQIYTWSVKSDSFRDDCDSVLFQNGNVLALLDPKEAPAGGASYTHERQRLIFAASNNAAHFKNTFKDTFGFERILNPYSTSELKIALRYMSPTGTLYSDDEVLLMLSYAEQVGNMPRYVLSRGGFDIISDKVQKYIQEDVEKMDSSSLLDFLRFGGIVGVESKESVKGAIFSLFAKGSLGEHYDLVDVGYDGDDAVDGKAVVQYDKRDVMFASSYTRRQIAKSQRATLLCYDGKTADGLGSHFLHIIEDLFWMDMEKNIKMKVYKLKYNEDKYNPSQEPSTVDFFFKDAAYYGRRTRLNELATTLFSENGNKYKFRMTTNCALFDFAAFQPPSFFQVTVGKKHTLNRQGAKDLFIACGILEERNQTLSYSEWALHDIEKSNLLQHWKLKYYWVVPEGVLKNWIIKKPLDLDSNSTPVEIDSNTVDSISIEEDAKKKKTKKKDILDDAWMKCVDQYAAVISPDIEYVKEEIE